MLKRLIGGADALIHNFPVGVMERLGFTEETIHAANPDCVVVGQSISEYLNGMRRLGEVKASGELRAKDDAPSRNITAGAVTIETGANTFHVCELGKTGRPVHGAQLFLDLRRTICQKLRQRTERESITKIGKGAANRF